LKIPQVWLANISLFDGLAHAYLECWRSHCASSFEDLLMNSLWKDLLFLHGHLVRKEDLVWRSDTCTGAERDKNGKKRMAGSIAVKCCAAVWPRLAGPR
jgi:hypothetical protein